MTILGSNDCSPLPDKGSIHRRKPRICMMTERGYAHKAFQCVIYEGQDVLLDIDDVDLMHIRPGRAFELRERIQKKLIWHDFTRGIIFKNMAFQPIELTKEYELFIVYCQFCEDLPHISAIRRWKDHCRTSLCWIDELWADTVPKYKSWLLALQEFDHVVVGLHGTINVLSDVIKKPCHFVPAAVDAIRFSPYPGSPARVIDIYSIGRKWERLHQTMLKLADKKKLFYVYDTFLASDTQVKDHRQHREMLANMAKRSKYFYVAPAKMNAAEETKGQIEVGYRYYEASAAGAIMLGQSPQCESFDTMFNWPDAVIEIKPDGSDLADVLSSLTAQPERLSEISYRNAMEALLRHDWVYRWKKILNIAGLTPMPGLELREKKLKQMADQIGNEK